MGEFKLKDYKLADTIAAIATFPAKSALGVIRISGPKAFSIIEKVFKPAKKKDIKKAKSHTLHYGWIVENSKSESIVDEVLISLMRQPGSYTREDVIEISTHGGVVVANKVLELLIDQGARLAQRGEFTYRALINGRINLLQAQAIRDIVEARTDEGLKLSQKQLAGEASERLELLKEDLKNLYCQVEAYLNFPEDQLKLSYQSIKKDLRGLKARIEALLKGARAAKILKEGLSCVICGKTNAGKSTLFNCLLKQERVIVSKLAGTTRDVIEETIDIRGVPLRIYDTAGLIEPKDLVTKKALEKTNQSFESADLIIFMLDNSRALNKDDLFLLKKIKNKNTIMVINKIDLKSKLKTKDIAQFKVNKVYISALKKKGIKDLEKAVFEAAYGQGLDRENAIFLSHYQQQFLNQAKESISEACAHLDEGQTIDFVSFSLKECLDSLGKLNGEVPSEEILENIFSNFCIGK